MIRFSFLLIAIFFASITGAQQLTVERIWRNYEFSAKGAGAYELLNDGQHYVEWSEEGHLVKGDLTNPQAPIEMLIDKAKLIYNDKAINVTGFQFNASEQKILLITAPQSTYRSSFAAS